MQDFAEAVQQLVCTILNVAYNVANGVNRTGCRGQRLTSFRNLFKCYLRQYVHVKKVTNLTGVI